jgi:hypothetical protein
MNSKYRVEFPEKLKPFLEMVFNTKRQPKHFGVELLPFCPVAPEYLIETIPGSASSALQKSFLSFNHAHRLR